MQRLTILAQTINVIVRTNLFQIHFTERPVGPVVLHTECVGRHRQTLHLILGQILHLAAKTDLDILCVWRHHELVNELRVIRKLRVPHRIVDLLTIVVCDPDFEEARL